MGISNKLRTASDPFELFLILRITIVLLTLPALLKLLNIRRVVRLLTPRRTGTLRARLSRDRVVYLCGRMLNTFIRFPYRVNCLRRCLLVFHCLRRTGIPVVINFGVKPDGEQLVGHSWLTLDGRLIYDRAEMVGQFAHMFSLPESAPGGDKGPEMDKKIADLKTVSFDE